MKNRMILLLVAVIMIFSISGCTIQLDVPSGVALNRKEKIHYDIAVENIHHVNISGNARSIIIRQSENEYFEFYNGDLNTDHTYEVRCEENGDTVDINILMENAEDDNDVLGSPIIGIPQKEFEKIEVTGDFGQISLYTINSDVLIHANKSLVYLNLEADHIEHNITLDGSEANAFRGVSVYLDKLPENVKIKFPNIPQSAINAPFGLLTGDKLELGTGKPVISINNADKLDFYVETPSDEIPSVEAPSEEDDKIEISMEDVIAIGKDEADKYYDDLQLTNVYSYDNDHDRSVMSGDDGKREWWYVNFANEKNNYVSIMIVDGEVANVEHFDQNGNNRLIDMDDVYMTADEAVQKAKDYGLVGGDPDNESHWVSGYNFKLSYASLVSSPDDYRIFLEVIGISPNGNFAHIDFDATTGELILAEEEIEYSNGDVEWKSFN